MAAHSDGKNNWVDAADANTILDRLDELQEYLEGRFEGHEKAMDELIREVQLVQENQRVSTIAGANFTVPAAAKKFQMGMGSTTTLDMMAIGSPGSPSYSSPTAASLRLLRMSSQEDHLTNIELKDAGDSSSDDAGDDMNVRSSTRIKKMRRGSSRVSFVRKAMMGKHMQAQEAASRLTFVRSGIRYSKSIRPLTRRERLARFLSTTFFNNIIMCLILSNALMLGIEIDVSSTLGQNEIPGYFGVMNMVLVAVFVLETLLKIVALGCDEFWRGEDAPWNIFDFCIVSISVVESMVDLVAQSISAAGGSGSFRAMRALRLARTLRGVRIIRVFRYFSALRGLILSIFSTLGSLLWTLLLLLIVFYVFSCIFAQLVTDHCRFQTVDRTGDDNAAPVCPENLHYWDNIMDSMMTLFMAITGGINWEDAYIPLRDVSLIAMGMMNLFIVIGFFTILNVVTGVFVNTAIESANTDKDIATLRQMHKRAALVAAGSQQLVRQESLQQIFHEIDDSESNQVSIDELEEALTTNKLGSFMESLGINVDDIWSLFLLIDSDENGVIDLEEFVNGCMNLHGPAKSLQVAKMSYENKLTRQAIKHLTDDIRQVKKLSALALKFRLVREEV